jgi:adenylate cyclase
MGTLADAFNDMTRGLLLRERYRSVLNKVVSQDVATELLKGDVELGGENRLVTVLFADIRGFTALTEGMEPQQVIGLLNECMECLSRAIDAEGGVVDKFIGDEVMAVFGAPVTQEDHARRAVAAALHMRAEMARLNQTRQGRGERPLGVGVGINSGIAVAGNMGSTNRLNYTVVGDAVNLASRLAGQARAGEILISEATLRLGGEGIHAPLLGGRALKGFSSEVQVYAVEGAELGLPT